MLSRPLLTGGRHLPEVYVIGNKIFAFLRVACEYQQEYEPHRKMEVVSVMEAFGVKKKRDIQVPVNWNINLQIKFGK